jgi:HD-like signal output (HDOD) protein
MRKPAVLFVDDESSILDGIRRSLRGHRHDWDMEFLTSGAAALEHLSHTPCDVVVSDMRMPGMDGAELLAHICRRHPGVARVVLSGHTEREAAVRASVVGHRFLNKPCEGDALSELVEQLTSGMDDPRGAELRRSAGSVRCLPVLPEQMRRVAASLAAPDIELGAVIDAVVNSIGLAAKLLQLANSSFFGSSQRVTSVTHAVTSLGLPTLQALIATDPALWAADVTDPAELTQLAAVWRHSIASARLVRELASPGNAPYSEVAALLQDVGRLAPLSASCREEDAGRPAALHSDHVGADLLHLWGLPRPIVVAVAERYVPKDDYPYGLGVGGALRAAHLLLQGTECADPYDTTHESELGRLLAHPQLVAADCDWRLRAQQVAAEAAEALA